MNKLSKLALSSLLVISSFAATAQNNPPMNPAPQHSMQFQMKALKKLDLTDDQKTAINALKESMKAEKEAAQATQKAEMDKLMNGATFDAALAEKMVQAQQTQREMAQLKFKYEMNKILTPEQKTLLQQQKDKKGQGKNDKKPRGNNK